MYQQVSGKHLHTNTVTKIKTNIKRMMRLYKSNSSHKITLFLRGGVCKGGSTETVKQRQKHCNTILILY